MSTVYGVLVHTGEGEVPFEFDSDSERLDFLMEVLAMRPQPTVMLYEREETAGAG